jgi:hypothetical protein
MIVWFRADGQLRLATLGRLSGSHSSAHPGFRRNEREWLVRFPPFAALGKGRFVAFDSTTVATNATTASQSPTCSRHLLCPNGVFP